MKPIRFYQITAVFMSILFLLAGCQKSAAEQLKEQLELGQNYLLEMNYEEAVVAFSKAIELDPKSIDGYLGIGQAREGQAEAVLADNRERALGYYRQAAEAYEQVLVLSPQNTEIEEHLIAIYKELGDVEKYLEVLNQFKISGDARSPEDIQEYADFIERLTALCEKEIFEEILQLMQESSFGELQKFVQETGNPIILDHDGYGIGLYPVRTEYYGDCMVYYGQFSAGKRQGKGIWLGYHEGMNYYATGEWSEDLPNGAFEANIRNSNISKNMVINGKVENGLWDGSVQWTISFPDRTDSYLVSFTKGKWNILRYTESGVAIVAESPEGSSSGSMITHTPEKAEGIEGFEQQ